MGNAAFIRGFADTTLKSWEARDEVKRQMQKAEMLEKLRRETSDYEFDREEKARKSRVDKDFSELDGASGQFIMRNADGAEVGRRAASAGELENYGYTKQKRSLDLATGQAQLDNFAIDNARADRALSIQERAASDARASRREGLDTAPTAKKHQKANAILGGLKNAGFDDNVLIQAKSKMAAAIAQGKGEEWLDKFEAEYLGGLVKGNQYQQSVKARGQQSVTDALRAKVNSEAIGRSK